MNRIDITGDSSALSANGFANDVGAVTPGTTLFVLAATEVGDDLAHKVTIVPSGSVTGNYVIIGTDADGATQTETLATDTVNSVTSAKYYLTLTSVKSPAGLSTETVDIGWAAASVSPWEYLIYPWEFFGFGFVAVVDSGTPTYTVQHTYNGGADAHNHSTVASETTTQEGTYTTLIQAIRLSWAAAGEVSLHGLY